MKIDLKVLKLKFLKLIDQITALEKKQKILIFIIPVNLPGKYWDIIPNLILAK